MPGGNYIDGNGTTRNRYGDSVVMSDEDRAEMNRLGMSGEQWLDHYEQRKQREMAIHADIESEKAVISVLLRHPELLPFAAETEGLKPRHFYDDANRELFRVINDMGSSGKAVDLITVVAELGKRHAGDRLALDAVGGSIYVSSLHRLDATEAHIRNYASEIVEQAERRRQETFAVQLVEQIQRRLPSEIVADQICHFAESEKEKQAKKEGPPTVKDLVKVHKELRPVVVDGLLREGEVMNIIAAPKMGKSWLVIALALMVACGRWWLQKFRTVKGRVLIVDNELHPETSADRVPRVAEALGLSPELYENDLLIDNMRGKLVDVFGLEEYFAKFKPGDFKLIILDAWYRFFPAGTDENGNNAALYNCIDKYAARLKCAFVLIHHSTKGNQSGKGVTDVGSGGGVQSRAADTHLILRPHEETDVLVLEAVTRSWKPVEPFCLRGQFPIWIPDSSLDPTRLRPDKPQRRKEQTDKDQDKPAPWTAERFAAAFITSTPQPKLAIVDNAVVAGITDKKAENLLSKAAAKKLAHRWKSPEDGREVLYANVKQPPEPSPGTSHGNPIQYISLPP